MRNEGRQKDRCLAENQSSPISRELHPNVPIGIPDYSEIPEDATETCDRFIIRRRLRVRF